MSQQQRRTIVVRMSASQVSAGPFDLDYRWSGDQIRTISGSLASSVTLNVLVSPVPNGQSSPLNVPVTFSPNTEVLSNHTSFFCTVSAYTGTFKDVINGPWARVWFVKDASGTADIYVLG